MDDPRLEEILRRLDRIERQLDEHEHDDRPRRRGRRHRCRCHDEDDYGERHGRGQPFEEKRVVDLIVELVTKRVDELLWRYEQKREEASRKAAEAAEDLSDSSEG